MKLLSFVVVLCVISLSRSHTVHSGRTCPSVTPFPNLSIDKVLGKWYALYRFDESNNCIIWTLRKSETRNGQLEVSESRKINFLGSIGVDFNQTRTADLDMPNPEVPARLRVRWPTSPTGKADFVIFDTDYENYVAIFQCDRAGWWHRRDVTILSKTPALNDIYVERVRRLLDTAGVPHDYMNIIDHNSCGNSSDYNWHIAGELLGLIPPPNPEPAIQADINDYDISQLEIIGEGITSMKENEAQKEGSGKPKRLVSP